jgi:hypothetical protein
MIIGAAVIVAAMPAAAIITAAPIISRTDDTQAIAIGHTGAVDIAVKSRSASPCG